jgi:phosphomannomutase
VRILGEGSNGGNITHPAAVRDPLNTILAVLKLLYAPEVDGRPAPLRYWTHRDSEAENKRHSQPSKALVSIADIIDTLPTFTTTSAFEPGAMMQIGTAPHAQIKSRFEQRFEAEYQKWQARLARELGISGYEFINYEGTEERKGAGARTGQETGGFKVLFRDSTGTGRAFLWMRGSKTEPVFRIMVDVEGDRPDLEQDLLDWLRAMVERAMPA